MRMRTILSINLSLLAAPALLIAADDADTGAIAAAAPEPSAEAEVATPEEFHQAIDEALAQAKDDTEKTMAVFEESVHAFSQVMDSAFRMAQTLEESLQSDEFKQFSDKLQKDLEEAARPMKEINWQGLADSAEDMATEDWEAIEAMTYQFFKHLAESLEKVQPEKTESDEKKPAVPPEAI